MELLKNMRAKTVNLEPLLFVNHREVIVGMPFVERRQLIEELPKQINRPRKLSRCILLLKRVSIRYTVVDKAKQA